MSEQEAFEKLFTGGYELANTPENYDLRQFAYKFWQAATAESNKRIAALEGEVANLHLNIKAQEQLGHELQASNNDLREALNFTINSLDGRGIPQNVDPANLTVQFYKCKDVIREALSATPVESLAKHDDELLERAALACEELDGYMPAECWQCVAAIRALKVEHG